MGSAHKLKEVDNFDEVSEHLQPGETLLQGQYTIESYLNSGGFGITYTARDSLDRKVVIKECYPNAFCQRSQSSVRVRLREHQADFKSVVRLFVEEAKSLSKLKHPNIVGVHQVFEDNNTAYMALDFIDGRDLHDTLSDKNHGLKPADVESILVQLLKAVGFMHKENILHRDISPDNILLDSRNKPVLIDFGAARQQIPQTDRVKSAFRVVKDGYSPQEFYLTGSQQSPSSDLYALAATFYHLIAGEAPPNSQSRLAAIAGDDKDPCIPLAERVSGYQPAFLEAIDKALKVLPKDRIQQASEWLALIGHGPMTVASDNKVVKLPQSDDKKDPAAMASASLAAGDDAAKAIAPAGKSRLGLLLASAAVIALVGGVAVYQFSGSSEEKVAIAQPSVEQSSPVVVAEPLAEPVVAETAAVTPPETPEPQAVETPAPVAVVTVPEPVNAAPVPPATPATSDAEVQISSAWSLPSASYSGPSNHLQPSIDTRNSEPMVQPEAGVNMAQLYVNGAAPDLAHQPSHETAPVIQVLAPMFKPVSDISVTLSLADIDIDMASGLTVPTVSGDVPSLSLMRLMADLSVADMVADAKFAGDKPPDPPAKIVVSAAPATVSSQSDKPSEDVILDAATVLSGWSVDLPFSNKATSANTIGSVAANAPSWAIEGVQITSVNGQPITSFDEIGEILRNSVEPGDANEIFVTFGTRQSANGPTIDVAASLPIVQEIVFLNGTKFDARFVDGKWQTQVVRIPGDVKSDLMAGDILQAYVPMGIDISGPDTLARILAQNASFKDVILNFTVLRDGGIWLASYAYKNATVF